MKSFRRLRGTTLWSTLCLTVAMGAGCMSQDEPAASASQPAPAAQSAAMPATSYNTDITVAELMDAVVMREADVVWNAVQYASTADGFKTIGPETDEDWDNLLYAAKSLAEVTNNLIIPGRHANQPDAEGGEGELTPAEIDALIMSQHGAWTSFAAALRASADQAITAIESRDLDKIIDVGGAIDEACENCHLVFWYPNQ